MARQPDDERNDHFESNPFVTFRRFADEQMVAAFHTLNHPLAMIRDAQLHRASLDRHDDVWNRLERAFERSMNPERKQIDRMDDGATQRQPQPQVESRTISSCPMLRPREASTSDDDDDKKRESLVPDAPVHRNGSDSWTRDGMGLAWNLDFFDSSPYSPLKLEKENTLGKSNINWRQAFEDLLVLDAADDGYKLQSRAQRDAALDHMPGKQWKALLLQSGLLSTQGSWHDAFIGSPFGVLSQMLKELHSVPPQVPQNEHEFYESMAAREESNLDSKSKLGSLHHAFQPERGAEQQRPSIVSTFKKTERFVHPDGFTSVTTVLKKKFSDGTEESEETLDSLPPNQQTPYNSLRAPSQDSIMAKVEEKKKKKEKNSGGWFW